MAYEYETHNNSPNYTPAAQTPVNYGMARVIEGITIHHWGDPNQNPQFDGIVNYLCRSNGNTSAHYVVTGSDASNRRRVSCIVNPGDTAWHSGSAWGNARTIGIELDPRARDVDYDVAAELIADIRSAYGDVPIYEHNYFTATACPGAYDHFRLDALSYTKYSHAVDWGKGGNKVSTPPPTPTPTPTVPTPEPVILFRLIVDGRQAATYSTEANAYKGYVQYGSKGKITLNGTDVTKKIIDIFTAPSPTSGQPESGMPTADKEAAEKERLRKEAIEKAAWEAEEKVRLEAIEKAKAIEAAGQPQPTVPTDPNPPARMGPPDTPPCGQGGSFVVSSGLDPRSSARSG